MGNNDFFGLTEDERLALFVECCQRTHVFELIKRLGGNSFTVSRLCVVGRAKCACSPVSRCDEKTIGMLVGVKRGCVLFVPENLGVTRRDLLLGSLRRRDNGTFVLDPLHPHWRKWSVSLTIHTPDQPNPPKHTETFRSEGAEAWLYQQIGAGMAETYEYLLFTPHRWSEMKEWLGHWLSNEEASVEAK
jgi:hypothetical protein